MESRRSPALCWRRLRAVNSRSFVGGQLARSSTTLSFHQPLRGLRCDAEIFVLMEDRVLRVFIIVLVPEDADIAGATPTVSQTASAVTITTIEPGGTRCFMQ